MNVPQVLLVLVQMHVCAPVAGTNPNTGEPFHALVCPVPAEVHDAIVEAASDPA